MGSPSTLESRVAMHESKREAVQSALLSLAPLQYKSQRPISGAVRRELDHPAAPPAAGPILSASEPDTPVDLNGVPRILGMPPGIRGRPATAPRTGARTAGPDSTSRMGAAGMHSDASALMDPPSTAAAPSSNGVKITTILNKRKSFKKSASSKQRLETADGDGENPLVEADEAAERLVGSWVVSSDSVCDQSQRGVARGEMPEGKGVPEGMCVGTLRLDRSIQPMGCPPLIKHSPRDASPLVTRRRTSWLNGTVTSPTWLRGTLTPAPALQPAGL